MTDVAVTTTANSEIATKLQACPRVSLAILPTPFHPLPRLTAALGGPEIWVKRDDMTGLAFGGNKTRQLEFVFAEVLKSGADTVIAGAYTQSNWCRQMSAAAAKLGLKMALVLVAGRKGAKLQGNFLLDKLLGADVSIVEIDSMEQLQPYIDKRADELRAQGRKVYIVEPMGLHANALGALGYVDCTLELQQQIQAIGQEFHHLYQLGSNMQPAGLALAMKALRMPTKLTTITNIRWSKPRDEDIADIANATAAHLGIATRVEPADVGATDDYLGPGHGIVTEQSPEALKLCAQTEGLILDPVYTSKAMAGLIDHIRKGKLRKGERVIFLHSGGTPALFAYAEDLRLG